MTDFQSKQLDYDRSGDRTRDLKHSNTLTISLRHRSITFYKNRLFINCFFMGLYDKEKEKYTVFQWYEELKQNL